MDEWNDGWMIAEISRHRSPGDDRKNFRKERKRGRRGGVRLRIKRQKKIRRIPLPSIITEED